jgi:hypothetical protein
MNPMNDMPYFSLAIVLANIVFFCAQFFVAIYYSVAKGHGIKGRWIFVFIAPLATMTILMTTLLLVTWPFAALGIYTVPAIKHMSDYSPFWLGFFGWLTNYWFLFALFFWGLFGIFFTRFLWLRWPALLRALLTAPQSGGDRR